MRYQTFARDHLDQALNSYEDLKKQFGEAHPSCLR